MAIENKRMQQRYGTYEQFEDEVSNLLPHEFASVISGDPSTTSGKGLYFYSGSGNPNRLLTDEDKSAMDSNINTALSDSSQALSTADSLQVGMNNLQSTVQSQGDRINNLESVIDDKVEMDDVEDYAYSKSDVQNILNMVLSNYYTSYIINDMISFAFGEITTSQATSRFAGRPHYSWVKLGFEVVNEQHVGGLCIMTIDSPLCTSNDTTLEVILPFVPANDMKISAFVGSRLVSCQITAGSTTLQIPEIMNGDKVSAFFAYRVSQGGQG